MKKHRLALIGLFAGWSALAVSSCAYDPYYSSTSYSGGYGSGYGYGGSNFSTSFFVSTGNPRWAYDPYAGCYYDYTRRCYYDPYLYGYYPVGYRPRYVVGAPHPHGWSRGRNYCPPPSRIRNHTIDNYDNRAQSYRSLGRDWSRNVTISAPANQSRPDFGGNHYQDRGFNGSRGSGFSQRPNTVPSWNDGRGGGSNGRAESGRGGLNREMPRESGSMPTIPMNRGEDRRNGSAGTFPGRQPRQQIERQPSPVQPRLERPAPPAIREVSPGSGQGGGRNRSEIPAPNGGSRGGQRGGMRALGEG
ncbi:MAG: hypothetical protein RLZZ505_833 [Verrucomicrobiota bacterium]|jgi:hypothetical protein